MITRPEPQNSELCEKIKAQGGTPIALPTIAFAPPACDPRLTSPLSQYNWLIFTSAQAVNKGLIERKALNQSCQVAALGAATVRSLEALGFSHIIHPESEWTSEGLLKEAGLRGVRGKRVLLVSGEGGRDVLAETLRARGAIVEHLWVYRRVIPVYPDIDKYHNLLNEQKIGIIICTSGESLHNLLTIIGADHQKLLLDVPLIVVSQRLVELAKKLNFQNVFLAKNASHDALINVLCQLKGRGYVR